MAPEKRRPPLATGASGTTNDEQRLQRYRDRAARAKRARVRQLIMKALEAHGCTFVGDIRDDVERALSRALDVIHDGAEDAA